MIQTLSRFSQQRLAWALLLLSAIGLFIAALVFQYALNLEPCLYCIYIRVAVVALALAALVGLLAPRNPAVAGVGFLGWAISAGWGLQLSLTLVEKQAGTQPTGLFGPSCDYIPNFPSWMPLHQWLPSLFEPRGQCGDEAWQWLGITMAEWMVVVFVIYLVMWALFAASRLARR
ncbi:disulfide bond formation protein DsbB [Ferrimonas marina]|uniref:Disulfide bond formation protein B n=1 Tax=Ferrimonas marina TaxID=299255 RepID=A0A1M5MVZ8_9GAMM|nr:disulfide bond formation protein DsbB [Ferrimonas marina]SHG81387.1 disulfide bond formation protein DsbB [Ferrimonas marina]